MVLVVRELREAVQQGTGRFTPLRARDDLAVTRHRVVDASKLRVEPQRWCGIGLAEKLLARGVHMIAIDVRIGEDVHELVRLELDLSGNKVQQERVLGHVERHAEKEVARPLVHHQRESSVGDEELEQRVAGGQRRRVELAGVPRGHEVAAARGSLADPADDVGELIDS